MESNTSIKSMKDAEREMAELRLALLGMGKAMAEWLSTVQPDSSEGEEGERAAAWRGLERVKETLLDSAGKEVEEIVREWGWHDGLEAPRSRATTPTPESSGSASASALASAVELSNSAQARLSDWIPADMTPIAPAVEVFPPTPRQDAGFTLQAPAPVAHGESSATSGPLSGGRPGIHLPKWDDGPMTGLPRVPMTAPILGVSPSVSTQSSRPESALSSPPSERIISRMDDVPDGDPLAGLGVGVIRKQEPGRTGTPKASSSGVDPLLGVGLR
jgi:TBC1 domain family protein 5